MVGLRVVEVKNRQVQRHLPWSWNGPSGDLALRYRHQATDDREEDDAGEHRAQTHAAVGLGLRQKIAEGRAEWPGQDVGQARRPRRHLHRADERPRSLQ